MTDKKRSVADDLEEGLQEARDFMAGKKTDVVVHIITPSRRESQKARKILGLIKENSRS